MGPFRVWCRSQQHGAEAAAAAEQEWIKLDGSLLVIDTLNTARALGLVSTKDKFDALALNVASVLWHLSPAMGGLGFSKVGWSGQLT